MSTHSEDRNVHRTYRKNYFLSLTIVFDLHGPVYIKNILPTLQIFDNVCIAQFFRD